MKANNLSISIPTPECDRCAYCVSKMTFVPKTNLDEFNDNLEKVIAIAERNAIDTILITGKGEPLEAGRILWDVVDKLENRFIVELQTNIKYLQSEFKSNEIINIPSGIDIVAISVDEPMQLVNNKDMLLEISKHHTIRITNVVTAKYEDYLLWDILDSCKSINAKQVTFRQLTIPKNTKPGNPQARNIEATMAISQEVYNKYVYAIQELEFRGKLNFGPSKYYAEGMSIIFMDYCVQDSSTENNRRSLIYQADGHLYDSWNFEESIIF